MQQLIKLLRAKPFVPFVIFTTVDGYIVKIGKDEREQLLAGSFALVMTDREGNSVYIPYCSMTRIEQSK
jgi:hypothetical protein